MSYHLAGIVSTVLFLMDLFGKALQLQEVWKRKKQLPLSANLGPASDADVERPTAVLSLNLFTMIFTSSYLVFVYGFSLPKFNHYLVWSRLVASIVVLMIIYEIMLDRKSWRASAAFWSCAVALLGGVVVLSAFRAFAVKAAIVPQFLVVLIAAILAQGNAHQISMIRHTRSTGAISLPSRQLVVLKDFGTIAFGLTMGLAVGWPLIISSASSAVLTLILIWHFRWVRLQGAAVISV